MSVDTYYWLVIFPAAVFTVIQSHYFHEKHSHIKKHRDCTNPQIKRFVFCDHQHSKWTDVTVGDSCSDISWMYFEEYKCLQSMLKQILESIVESALNYPWIDVPPWQLQDQIIQWFCNYSLSCVNRRQALCRVCQKTGNKSMKKKGEKM